AYSRALEGYLALGGPDIDARAAATCAELGLPADRLDVPVGALSGGERARAALAAILLARFDVFLLDEPTNDLDLDGLDRLEGFAVGLAGAAVIVSHDRAFLDRTVTRIVELHEATTHARAAAPATSSRGSSTRSSSAARSRSARSTSSSPGATGSRCSARTAAARRRSSTRSPVASRSRAAAASSARESRSARSTSAASSS